MIPGKKYTPADFFAIAARWKWLLICPPFVGLFVALVVSSRLPDQFQSDTLISIVPQRVPDSFVQSTVTLRIEERLDAITQQTKSRTQLESLINEFNLYPELRGKRQIEDIVAVMRENVQVELEAPRRGPRGFEPAHAFHVRFTYYDPQVAAAVTQRLGSMFVNRNSLERGALAEATNEFLESQLADARSRLEAQEAKVEEFRKRHGNELPTQLESNMQAIQSARVQVQALVESGARDRDRKLMLERLYNEALNEPAPVAVQPAPAPAGAAVDAVPTTGTARQQLEALKASLATLTLRLTPEHPDVQRTRRMISELEPKAAAEAEAAAAAVVSANSQAVTPAVSPEDANRRERLRQMRAEIESLDRQLGFKAAEEEKLNATLATYQRRLEAVPGLESEWTSLNRDYATLSETYRTLLQKSEASRIAVNLEDRQIGEQFRILDNARVPTRPVAPVRLQISGIGFGIGLFLGLVSTALLVLRDSSFRTEADVFQALSLPVLAVVPAIEGPLEERRRQRRRLMTSGAMAATVMVCGYVVWALKLWKFVA